MSASKPLTPEEERALFNNRGFVDPHRKNNMSVGDVERLFATLDAERARAERLEQRLATLESDNARLREALEDVVCQFAYWGNGGLITGGLSALEDAFSTLGWSEPHLCPDQTCDEPGCKERSSCGTPTPSGYRTVCGKHFAALAAQVDQP
jgi:hypothetical protein